MVERYIIKLEINLPRMKLTLSVPRGEARAWCFEPIGMTQHSLTRDLK